MAYPDLPPSATFWRCSACGNESLFSASGSGHIECARCHKVWSEKELLAAHGETHPPAAAGSATAH